jgi:hypothetical protein
MSADLSARRAEAEAELQALRVARGKALLDGREFAHQTRITVLEQFIEASTAAEGVSAERQREADEIRRLQRVADLRSELAGLRDERLERFELLEMNVRNAVDNINAILSINARMAKVAHLISDAPIPTPLHQVDLVERIAGRLSGMLSTIKGYHQRFGHFTWFSTGLYSSKDSWAEKERRLLDAHLEPLISGATPKPKEEPLMISHQPEKALTA